MCQESLLGLLLNGKCVSEEFQTKFCMLDLTKFLFKYAKAPTEKYTYIHLKDIIDVSIEPDPGIIS